MKLGELKHINKFQVKCAVCKGTRSIEVTSQPVAAARLIKYGWKNRWPDINCQHDEAWCCRRCNAEVDRFANHANAKDI